MAKSKATSKPTTKIKAAHKKSTKEQLAIDTKGSDAKGRLVYLDTTENYIIVHKERTASTKTFDLTDQEGAKEYFDFLISCTQN